MTQNITTTQDISMQWEESQQPNPHSGIELVQNSANTLIQDTPVDGIHVVIQDTQKRLTEGKSPIKRIKIDVHDNTTQQSTVATTGESPMIIPNTDPVLEPKITTDETLVAPTGPELNTLSPLKSFIINETLVENSNPVVDAKILKLEIELSNEKNRADEAEKIIHDLKIKLSESENKIHKPSLEYSKGDSIIFSSIESSLQSFGQIISVSSNTVVVMLYAISADAAKKKPTHSSWSKEKALILLNEQLTIDIERIVKKIIVLKGDDLSNTYCLREMITSNRTLKSVS